MAKKGCCIIFNNYAWVDAVKDHATWSKSKSRQHLRISISPMAHLQFFFFFWGGGGGGTGKKNLYLIMYTAEKDITNKLMVSVIRLNVETKRDDSPKTDASTHTEAYTLTLKSRKSLHNDPI